MSQSHHPLSLQERSRRLFLKGTGTATAALAAGAASATAQEGATAAVDEGIPAHRDTEIALIVNGRRRTLLVENRTTLLDAVRERLGLTGTKVGCNHGQCGACTVLLNGRRVNACLTLALQADGGEVTTIEGLESADGELHPMQQAFIDHDAFQCGYCTPGQILSAIACIEEGHASDDEQIREYMSGNLCRCGAYPNIVAAVKAVRDQES